MALNRSASEKNPIHSSRSPASGNARYWYRRADRMEHVEDEPRKELAAIQNELRSER